MLFKKICRVAIVFLVAIFVFSACNRNIETPDIEEPIIVTTEKFNIVDIVAEVEGNLFDAVLDILINSIDPLELSTKYKACAVDGNKIASPTPQIIKMGAYSQIAPLSFDCDVAVTTLMVIEDYLIFNFFEEIFNSIKTENNLCLLSISNNTLTRNCVGTTNTPIQTDNYNITKTNDNINIVETYEFGSYNIHMTKNSDGNYIVPLFDIWETLFDYTVNSDIFGKVYNTQEGSFLCFFKSEIQTIFSDIDISLVLKPQTITEEI